MRCLLLVALIVATPSVVLADGVADELSAGTTLATETAPASSWIANTITGVWDVDDRFTMQIDFSLTRSTSVSKTGSLSLSYLPSTHWSLSVAGSWVPASTSTSTTTLVIEELDDDVVLADADLVATSSSTSLAVSVGYDTAGDSNHETTASITLGVDHVQSQQTFASIIDDSGEMLTTEDVREYCETTMCDPEIEAALSPLYSQLSRFAISGSVVRTEFQTIDLGLDATYYFYDKDPKQAGYFRLPGIGPSNLGDGVAIAPMRYAVSPSVGSKWGKLASTLGLAYGSYLSGEGYEVGVNLKVAYRLDVTDDTTLKLYSSLGSSWNVDLYNDLTTSLSIALGGKYTW